MVSRPMTWDELVEVITHQNQEIAKLRKVAEAAKNYYAIVDGCNQESDEICAKYNSCNGCKWHKDGLEERIRQTLAELDKEES